MFFCGYSGVSRGQCPVLTLMLSAHTCCPIVVASTPYKEAFAMEKGVWDEQWVWNCDDVAGAHNDATEFL